MEAGERQVARLKVRGLHCFREIELEVSDSYCSFQAAALEPQSITQQSQAQQPVFLGCVCVYVYVCVCVWKVCVWKVCVFLGV